MAVAETPDHVQLWYDRTGSGPQAVLLIAGQAMSHRSWVGLPRELRKKRTVIRYDHRGVGASESRFPTGWSTRDFARDAIAVLDAAGVERAAVVGHAMGGQIAQWVAADYPDRVSALVLAATSIGDPQGVVQPPEATAALVTGTPGTLIGWFVSPTWLVAHPDQEVAMTPDPVDVAAQKAHFGAGAMHDGSTALDDISAPTLVLHGELDQICRPGNAHILADRIRGAKLAMIPRGRHLLLADSAQARNAVIAFLNEREERDALNERDD